VIIAGRLVRSARLRAGLTQRSLADRSGVPQPTIAAIEAGRRDPRLGTVLRLLAACGRELEHVPRLGEGIDRTTIRPLLQLSPAERLRTAVSDARVLRVLDRAGRQR